MAMTVQSHSESHISYIIIWKLSIFQKNNAEQLFEKYFQIIAFH